MKSRVRESYNAEEYTREETEKQRIACRRKREKEEKGCRSSKGK